MKQQPSPGDVSLEDCSEGRFQNASAGPKPWVSVQVGVLGAPAARPATDGAWEGLFESSAAFGLYSSTEFDVGCLKSLF